MLPFRNVSITQSVRAAIVLGMLFLIYEMLPAVPFDIGSSATSYIHWRDSGQHKINMTSEKKVDMVIASQKKDDVAWLQERPSGWQQFIYVVDDDSANLTVPTNKGREAMVYLTYALMHKHHHPQR